MGKIYNYVFNVTLGSGTDNTKQFSVDWDKMPDNKPLKLTFAFNSSNAGNVFNQSANIYCNLGQSHNIIAGSDSFVNYRSDYLGFLKPDGFSTGTGASTYTSLTADNTTNPPTYLYRRPPQSNISIEIRASISPTTNYNNPLGTYTLVLCFEELE
jgi:hypothetical protein